MADQPSDGGWGFPMNSKKAHFFVGGRSLCGKWLFFGRTANQEGESPDDCLACRRKLIRAREKEAASHG